ncbi:SDR family oxidoreductase [Ktedonosporobacter rubrisoli]|uniref:SDR family oxidoreductase n=1 Tax=Ktedonosporobacter rubrisoli TaxID=2509675 RepID=A0A4P6JKH8_KTERU|nr:SDR family oxidoreductase [Ktedonosporobacter rubrisoli]QBD75472.1 SDR family oxidoreductase [Ktedonosporobacter rubrisoli]
MSQTAKIALITGANKGIGFEIARQLGEQGLTVLVGSRDLARGEEAVSKIRAAGSAAYSLQIDVIEQATIDAAVKHVEQTYGRLDVLVNNAGITRGFNLLPSQFTIEQLREVYETNVFGVFAVTKAMLPLLYRSQAGRIVNLSSPMGSLTLNSDPSSIYATLPPSLAYNSSKTALNALTVFFARELRDTNIKINSVSPGYCATDLNGHTGYRTAQQGAQLPVAFATLPADGPTGGFFEDNKAVPW